MKDQLLEDRSARLSYLAVYKFWIVGEAPRNRFELDRNRCVLVSGHRPGHLWLGFVWFGGRLGPKIDDFRPDSFGFGADLGPKIDDFRPDSSKSSGPV